MKLKNLLTGLLLFIAAISFSQAVVRPSQIVRADAVETARLVLRKGVFTGKALSIDSTAKSSTIPSALAVYNYVNQKAVNEAYTIVTDTVNIDVTRGTTVFNFAADQSTFTVTLPETPDNGDVVWLLFNKSVTVLTVTADEALGGAAVTSATAGTTAVSYIFIGGSVNKWFRRD